MVVRLPSAARRGEEGLVVIGRVGGDYSINVRI